MSAAAEAVPNADWDHRRFVIRLALVYSPSPLNRMNARSPARPGFGRYQPASVTAAVNLNLLARINRELDADFNLRHFHHEARYHSDAQRIEMHLR